MIKNTLSKKFCITLHILKIILFLNKGYAKRRRNLINICFKAYIESNATSKNKAEIREMPQLKSKS
jgi:hypothetical protein